MLYVLIVIPVFIILFHIGRSIKKKKIAEFGDTNLMQELMPEASTSRPVWKFYLFITAVTFIILGLARPQIGSKLQEVKRRGIQIMIALDVSNSMNARDIEPSRLERAKLVLAKVVERLENDKIGLIVFAGDAYTQIPITSDYVSVKMFLSNISTGMVPVQGTDIGIQPMGRCFCQACPRQEWLSLHSNCRRSGLLLPGVPGPRRDIRPSFFQTGCRLPCLPPC
jgi:Ca-activated chloride channel family protein